MNSLLANNLKFEHFVNVNITCGNIDLLDTVKSTKTSLKFTLVLYYFLFCFTQIFSLVPKDDQLYFHIYFALLKNTK